MTRGAIEYDFNKSPYRITVDGNTFVFSSQLHLDKFKDRQAANRAAINTSLSNRFNIDVDFPLLSDVLLYRSIEQRGFLIIFNGGEIKCQNNIKFDGERLTQRKPEKPLNASMQK